MIVVLDDTIENQAVRYASVLASIDNDPSRFGDLTDDDASWCVGFLHARLILLTQAMQARATEAESEAAVAYWLHTGRATLDRQVSLAVHRLQRGLPQTLRDLAAVWVSNCAIKEQIACELERRRSAMN